MMEYYTVMKIEIICIYPEKEKGGTRERERDLKNSEWRFRGRWRLGKCRVSLLPRPH